MVCIAEYLCWVNFSNCCKIYLDIGRTILACSEHLLYRKAENIGVEETEQLLVRTKNAWKNNNMKITILVCNQTNSCALFLLSQLTSWSQKLQQASVGKILLVHWCCKQRVITFGLWTVSFNCFGLYIITFWAWRSSSQTRGWLRRAK